MKIKRIKPISLAKVYGLMTVTFGLLVGVIGAITAFTTGGQNNAVPAIMVLIGFPLMYGVVGFVMGLIGAVVYNVIASRTGGIEIEAE